MDFIEMIKIMPAAIIGLMMNLYKYGTLTLLFLIIAENSLKVNILHLSEMINAISYFFIGLMGFQ